MAVSSVHEHGISSWQARQSNQVSISLMDGSGGLSLLSSGSGSTSGSQKVTLLSDWDLLGDLGLLSREWLYRWLLLQLWEWVHCTSLIPQLNLSILLSSTWAASSTLWWTILASQRASSCESPLLLGLDRGSSTGPHVSLAAMGYTHQCNQLLREERMSQIASLLCCGPQGDLLNR